jgi:Cu2+-exporting ATPase
VTKKKFQIKGMHCVGCAMTVDEALEALPGVNSASTSYAKQVVEVVYNDQQVTEQQLVDAVRKAGYTATPA